MRDVIFFASAVLTLATLTAGGAARAEPSGCKDALAALGKKWNAIAYPMPLKPSQVRLIGKGGHEASGQQVMYMRGQIGLAVQECANGNESAALARVTKVSASLDGQVTRTAKQSTQ